MYKWGDICGDNDVVASTVVVFAILYGQYVVTVLCLKLKSGCQLLYVHATHRYARFANNLYRL